MERHLNLVTSDFEEFEKRILPKFPFCYLIFKTNSENCHVFEVKDISYSGMQISLKHGDIQYKEGEKVAGTLHWGDTSLLVMGTTRWSKDNRAGVEFNNTQALREEVEAFLKLEHLAKMLKPVHKLKINEDFPPKLKYWLRADGPIEVFVWSHDGGQLSKIQIVIMENFVEWEDTKGLKTARVISKRDINTPLLTEDEFVFKFDSSVDPEKLDKAAGLIAHVDPELLDKDSFEFINLKIRV